MTTSPWREWDGDLEFESPVVLVRDGTRDGGIDLLAHALRSDGVASNLSHAYRLADTASYYPAHYGYVEDDREPVVCDENGLTRDGSVVSVARPCVFALIAHE